MITTFTLRKKGSSVKVSSDNSVSPYNQVFVRPKKEKAKTEILKKIPTISRKDSCNFHSPDKQKPRHFKPISYSQAFDSYLETSQKTEELEKLLRFRLDKFKSGDSEYNSEIEIADSIYDNLMQILKPYMKIFTLLRETYKSFYYDQAKEHFKAKLDKLDKEKNGIIKKISRLSDINASLMEEKQILEQKTAEFERMFEANPKFLINYQNIVSQMLGQCEQIENQKKELNRLKKVEETHQKLLKKLEASSFLENINPKQSIQCVI